MHSPDDLIFLSRFTMLKKDQLKNLVIVFSLYILVVYIINFIEETALRFSLEDQEVFFLAIPTTVIILFIYDKIAKRLSL